MLKFMTRLTSGKRILERPHLNFDQKLGKSSFLRKRLGGEDLKARKCSNPETFGILIRRVLLSDLDVSRWAVRGESAEML
jgi:hypothetical protein